MASPIGELRFTEMCIASFLPEKRAVMRAGTSQKINRTIGETHEAHQARALHEIAEPMQQWSGSPMELTDPLLKFASRRSARIARQPFESSGTWLMHERALLHDVGDMPFSQRIGGRRSAAKVGLALRFRVGLANALACGPRRARSRNMSSSSKQ